MRRVIRSRWLYIGLLVLLGVLYARAAFVGLGQAPLPAPPAPPVATDWAELPSDAELFRQVLAGERPGASSLLLLSLVLLGLGIGGVGLTLWGLVTGALDTAWRQATPRPPAWSFADVGRLLFLIVAMAMLLPFVRMAYAAWQPTWMVDDALWIPLSMLLLDSFVVLAILVFARSRPGPLGWATDRPGATIREALLAYVACFPWIFCLLLVAVGASRALGLEPPVEPIHRLLFEESRPAVLALTMGLAGIIGPVDEELFFRGVFYGALRQRNNRWVAMLISGAIFSLVHTNHVGFLPILGLGCLLAFVYERSGSLLAPTAIHITHNSLLLALSGLVRTLGLPA